MTEFEAWASNIIELSGKFADEESMKFAIATMLIHAESHAGRLPLNYFVSRLRKVAANQVAGQVFQDIKTKQAEAAAAKQQAEATAATSAASDVKPSST